MRFDDGCSIVARARLGLECGRLLRSRPVRVQTLQRVARISASNALTSLEDVGGDAPTRIFTQSYALS